MFTARYVLDLLSIIQGNLVPANSMYKATDAMYTSCMGRLDLFFQKSLPICDMAGLYAVPAVS